MIFESPKNISGGPFLILTAEEAEFGSVQLAARRAVSPRGSLSFDFCFFSSNAIELVEIENDQGALFNPTPAVSRQMKRNRDSEDQQADR